ncbi:uncharacterized protein LOC141601749 [Silene latifolia]|uniref:uncharacterized protein LOC141601749 n=1 Tax=Silene latifolia TaxID=37657 RepID=UPI003D77D635
MIFVRGDVPSVTAVKTALSQFALISGLHANIDKTNVYFGGVSQSILQEILDAIGFSLGQFPFRYLGLPLATSKLKNSIFDSLVTKIQKSIHHWSSQCLSYAGRAQLLNSVIFGLDNICGFNIKDLLSWNQALLMKWVWKLSVPAASLWATWIDLCPETGNHLPTPVGDWVTSLNYSGILPSHRIISSIAVQGQLATVDNLQRRGFSLANR